MIELNWDIIENPVFILISGLVLGAIVGSFLNVCISRIPENKSIVLPSSSCPKCGTPIRWFYNIPIFSWLALKGKAQCCDFKLPFRYFLVELLTALIFAFIFVKSGYTADLSFCITALFFSSVLVIVIGIDFETMTIPDRFSIGGAMCGLIFSFCFPSLQGLADEPIMIERMSSAFISLTGLLVSSATLYWIGAVAERLMNKEALGQGDVKLLGFVGAFCGWQGGLFVIFGGALLGTVVLFPIMIISKFLKKSNANQEPDQLGWGMEVPFGPFLGLAGLFYFLGLQVFVDDWFEGIISNFIFVFSTL